MVQLLNVTCQNMEVQIHTREFHNIHTELSKKNQDTKSLTENDLFQPSIGALSLCCNSPMNDALMYAAVNLL